MTCVSVIRDLIKINGRWSIHSMREHPLALSSIIREATFLIDNARNAISFESHIYLLKQQWQWIERLPPNPFRETKTILLRRIPLDHKIIQTRSHLLSLRLQLILAATSLSPLQRSRPILNLFERFPEYPFVNLQYSQLHSHWTINRRTPPTLLPPRQPPSLEVHRAH